MSDFMAKIQVNRQIADDISGVQSDRKTTYASDFKSQQSSVSPLTSKKSPLTSKKSVEDPLEDFASQEKKPLLGKSRTATENSRENEKSKGFERSMRFNIQRPMAQRLRNESRVSAINNILRKKSEASDSGQFLDMINVDVLKSSNN